MGGYAFSMVRAPSAAAFVREGQVVDSAGVVLSWQGVPDERVSRGLSPGCRGVVCLRLRGL